MAEAIKRQMGRMGAARERRKGPDRERRMRPGREAMNLKGKGREGRVWFGH